MKVVIVGGVAGGATAAARIRRLDEKAQIIVFERSGFVSYANCGLPYYVGGTISDERELTLQTPKSFWDRFRVDIRVKHEVMSIDKTRKTVTVHGLETGKIYEESYDKLILSPGAKPMKPELEGVRGDRIFTLRTVEDTFHIKQFVEVNRPKTVLLAGGGFIGLEVAENLIELGVDVTIVQRPKHLLGPVDEDMACQIHTLLRSRGAKLMLGKSVAGFSQQGDKVETFIKGENSIVSDMVLMAIGVIPDTGLAADAGLELGMKGSIAVNDRMETSAEDIYAVGDAVSVEHFVTGQRVVIPLAGPANKQGRIVADNVCGGDSRYKGSQGTSVIKLFDMTVATTGIKEEQAKAAGINYDKVILSPPSHATYYPGASLMTVKILYDRETLDILGGQIIGYDGVDKRIDVLATAARCGMKAPELKNLELAYAPPYSSAKDPLNMAGFMIENVETGKVKQFFYEDVSLLPRDGSVIMLDTRTPWEYDRGHVEGFVNIPVDDIRERLGELDRNKPVYVMCQSGLRSYITCRILKQEGFDCYNFAGGYRYWEMIDSERF
ncbi:MAG: FAD-dependent oxidoreductase [Clostridiales bacterium]|nr:FAD-dependent oxidoreductase [Clostridiales bacterium]